MWVFLCEFLIRKSAREIIQILFFISSRGILLFLISKEKSFTIQISLNVFQFPLAIRTCKFSLIKRYTIRLTGGIFRVISAAVISQNVKLNQNVHNIQLDSIYWRDNVCSRYWYQFYLLSRRCYHTKGLTTNWFPV